MCVVSAADFSEQVDHLINEMGAVAQDGAFCTSWLLVTEWTDGNGVSWLEEHRTSEMPPWKRLGLLYYVLDTDGEKVDDFDD
jgi:hypothetical protein